MRTASSIAPGLTVKLALGGLLALVSGCSPAAGPEVAPPPELTLHQVTFDTFRGSRRIAVGTAERLTYERTSGDSVATGARLNFLSARPTPAQAKAAAPSRHFRLEADRIVGNVPARLADAEGNVTLRDDQGLTGTTPRAHFDGPRSLAEGVDPVRIHGPSYRADAVGFKLLLDEDDLTLNGPVTSRFGDKR